MNEAELIKKITACLAKGNKAAEKGAGILLQKFWVNYAGQANRAHFWDNWEALLKTELGISRARRAAGGIALGSALPSKTDLHRRVDEYDRCADVRPAQEVSERARTASGGRARYIITFEPARGVGGVRLGIEDGRPALQPDRGGPLRRRVGPAGNLEQSRRRIPRDSRRDCGGARGTLFAAP